ncbi:DUF2536 family protein [Bacillus alkalicellulosilyticus]|uniref:DUF2536 family protein n=1 Tax=Alkalihalobacterium alkalicellulosilyticum TaxID=1912214 RepID=UPI000996C93D|nr:DUF2536 family protein [Bacillus alkalicellulosilyticus]
MIQLDRIEDKIECFEAFDLKTLELKINEQVENNKVLLLQVHHISYNVQVDPQMDKLKYSAIVHFKAKN